MLNQLTHSLKDVSILSHEEHKCSARKWTILKDMGLLKKDRENSLLRKCKWSWTGFERMKSRLVGAFLLGIVKGEISGAGKLFEIKQDNNLCNYFKQIEWVICGK